MQSSRRTFLGALTAGPAFVPRSAFGAGDRITYAVLATGGRGRYLMGKFTGQGAQCVAICDVYEPYLQRAKEIAPDAKAYIDYQELLDSHKDVDAVVIASPDHQHFPMLKAALAAKKDVYLEKPLSLSLEQSQEMIRAVRSSKQVVQIGMQRRSAPAIHRAKKLVAEGILGRVTLVKPQWHWNTARALDNSPLEGKLDWDRFLGPAPKRPLEPMRFRRWRNFFDYAGGNMTDQGTHLMDVVQWFMESGPPRTAVAQGFVAKTTGAEHPDVFSAVFEFENFIATWTLDYCNSFQNGWSITFLGDEGTMILDEEGFRVYKEPWKDHPEPILEEKAPVPVEAHVDNFLECVRTRKDPNCTVEIAAQAVAGPHLANLAMFKGRKAKLNQETGRATD